LDEQGKTQGFLLLHTKLGGSQFQCKPYFKWPVNTLAPGSHRCDTMYHTDVILCMTQTWYYLLQWRDTMYHTDVIHSITQTWYYVTHRCDTLFGTSNKHEIGWASGALYSIIKIVP
jgi:hypothetical protein